MLRQPAMVGGVVVSVVRRMNEVSRPTLRQPRLVLEWVTVSLGGYTITVRNQPTR